MTRWQWIPSLWALVFLPCGLQDTQPPNAHFSAEDWMKAGREDLNSALRLRHNLGVAKNVILFVGDGMGVSTVTAARIYKGQRDGRPGEETQLNFETFPNAAFAKTYNVDKQVPDSAGTSTAFLSGVKVNSGTLGVDARVQRQNCSLMPQADVSTVLDWAMAAGKWAGLVTTTHVTHATPAAAYAHTPERDWESDAAMWHADDLCKEKVKDIASQLVEDWPNNDIRVILGGGRKHFLPSTALIPGTQHLNLGGRLDGKDLIEAWLEEKDSPGVNASYVWNKQQLDTVDVNKTDFLMGLFNQGHMEFDLMRNRTGVVTEPSLADMVRKAIGVLGKHPQGFFLMVEGGRIDHAHHMNRAHLALGDTVAMDLAVGEATAMTGDETLILVTADHSHVFTMGGYPDKGHDILGVLDPLYADRAVDSMPYTTLTYANGPGPGRVNLTTLDTTSRGFQQSRLVHISYETHAGEDVAIYGQGPMAHLLHGVHEQSYIAHVMAYAACMGPYAHQCRQPLESEGGSPTIKTPSPPPPPPLRPRPSSPSAAVRPDDDCPKSGGGGDYYCLSWSCRTTAVCLCVYLWMLRRY
ncbi:hypothetical protein ACOMHN_052994 [Nucella lapillus]